jgi:hypothetical protein
MSSGEKITLNNIHGKDVEVTAAQVGDLIATLQCLPEAIENGSGDDLEHTAGVLKQRLEDIGHHLRSPRDRGLPERNRGRS